MKLETTLFLNRIIFQNYFIVGFTISPRSLYRQDNSSLHFITTIWLPWELYMYIVCVHRHRVLNLPGILMNSLHHPYHIIMNVTDCTVGVVWKPVTVGVLILLFLHIIFSWRELHNELDKFLKSGFRGAVWRSWPVCANDELTQSEVKQWYISLLLEKKKDRIKLHEGLLLILYIV